MPTLNHKACYPAVERDDPRFDGQFVTAVLTTGIFCRSICKAQTPRPENVRFFSTAAAAAEAGFRPCLRCRPESAPDPPLWQAVSPVVSRALQYIGEGMLNEAGVHDLAQRLNVSTRHLQRLFLDELGTPPVSVAQTRRLLFAKKLIDETNLSMTEVAFSAGYSSVRRFNEAIRQTYGRTPTEIRSKRRSAIDNPNDCTVALRLFYREPYNWNAMLEFLERNGTPFVEQINDLTYRRAIRIGADAGVIEVQPVRQRNAVLLRVPVHMSRHLLVISERVKQLFDFRADPIAVENHLRDDRSLGEVVRRHPGIRIPGTWDAFELAVRALLDQSFGTDRARLAMGLIVRTLGEELAGDERSTVTHLFPSPVRLSEASSSEYKLPDHLVAAIRAVCQLFVDDRVAITISGDPRTMTERLSSVPGIGEQSARYIVTRALSLPDVDISDYPGLLSQSDGSATTDSLAPCESWHPWSSYAAMYVWFGTRSVSANRSRIGIEHAEHLSL